MKSTMGLLCSALVGETSAAVGRQILVDDLQDLSGRIIGAAIAVHRELGPGLLESTYQASLAYELEYRGLVVEKEQLLPVRYKGIELQCGYRLDLVVESKVIVELKAVKSVEPIDHAQILSYLKLSGYPIGLLINFNVPILVDGVKRFINKHRERSTVDAVERPEDRWSRQGRVHSPEGCISATLSVGSTTPSTPGTDQPKGAIGHGERP